MVSGGAVKRAGDPELVAQAYAEIRRIARGLMSRGGERLLLQPTDLANDAVIRLLRGDGMAFESRGHLLATAAKMMRGALIDEIRKASAGKRQAPSAQTLIPSLSAVPIDLDLLDRAVAALLEVSPEHARIVELRFTLGMTVEEAAEAMGLAPRTLKRRWAAARTWLQHALEAESHGLAT